MTCLTYYMNLKCVGQQVNSANGLYIIEDNHEDAIYTAITTVCHYSVPHFAVIVSTQIRFYILYSCIGHLYYK